MATLIVPATTDFFGQTLNNISVIQFTNAAAAATATFLNTQFDNVAILDNVLIDGSVQENHISAFGGSVSALSWTFANWTDGVDTISLRGGDGDDVIIGSVKSDQFHASFGSDSLFGGQGNDTFTFFSSAGVPGEIIDGGDGLDTIVVNNSGGFEASQMAGIEVLKLADSFHHFGAVVNLSGDQIGIGAITSVIGYGFDQINIRGATVDLSGVSFSNWGDQLDLIGINGTDGADILRGSVHRETMSGGLGDDQYLIHNTTDIITEFAGFGHDRLFTFVSYKLPANVERLYLSGTLNINGAGRNEQNDFIYGNTGNNIINGFAGSDNMNGGLGDDTYYVSTSADMCNEAAGGGLDTIFAQTGYTIAANVERLFLLDGGNYNANGRNGQNDFLAGNTGNNIINGFSGDDTIRGGLGNDTLTGGAGLDTFQFLTAPNTAANRDIITDFNVADDTIQLDNAVYTLLGANGALAANLFKNLLTAQDADDRILYDQANGNLYYDSNGLAAGGVVHFAEVSNGLALTAGDFVVV